MLEGIPTNIVDVGPWGLLILVVALNLVSYVKGWQVPKNVLDIWVEAYRAERAAREQQDADFSKLLENSTLTVDLLRSIKSEAARRKTGDPS